MNKFYTYAYLREDRTPYYIGKGTGDRIYSKSRRVKPPKDKSRIIYLKKNLTEEEAFRHEIHMIAVFGRKDLGTGILRNETDGGEGISNPSEETRKKMSETHKGKIFSEETKKRMSESGKGRVVSEETRRKIGQWQIGKTLSEETKRKLSVAKKGKTHSEKTRRKMSESGKGKIFSEETKRKLSVAKKGKTLSEETKRKLSVAKKGKTPSEETRKKQSDVMRGKKWWNDGCGNRKRMIECPGDNWRLGRK